jgi:competence protein CoiA
MLTCKVGNTLINCFDEKYDKYTLKQWSDKSKLICPDCNKPYEYCHGEIKLPYFRHKEKSKECEGIYFESETQEHINGKLVLYKWLLRLQEKWLIQNVKLESYIPETRQRPDLYFEINNNRYVIEYQCSPIATEYLERHRLYKLAKVYDIWIMGTEKYNLHIDKDGYASHKSRFKVIEKNVNYYLNTNNHMVYFSNKLLYDKLPYKHISLGDYLSYELDDFDIINNNLFINNDSLNKFIKKDIELEQEFKIKKEKELLEIEKAKKLAEEQKIIQEAKEKLQLELVDKLNTYCNYCGMFDFSYREGNPTYYNWGIHLNSSIQDYVFFIKDNSIDCCYSYEYSDSYYAYSHKKHKKTIRWGKRTGYSKVDTFEGSTITNDDVFDFIKKHITILLERQKEEQNRIKKEQELIRIENEKIFSTKIVIIDFTWRSVKI